MWRGIYPILIFVGLAAGILAFLAPSVWLVLPIEGTLAAMTLASAAGWGAWPLVWLGYSRRRVGKQICLATALGLGWLGLATLGLGVMGLLNHPVGWVLLGGGLLLGVIRLYREQHTQDAAAKGAAVDRPAANASFQVYKIGILLGLLAPLVMLLFTATLPPGILWNEEGNAFDVLEYHLQGPREYFQAGRIEFLPHNVYTSFPQQMEMLYLLQMHLMGDPYAGAIPSQLLHAACGILAALAVLFWSRPGVPRWTAVLLIGSTPWLTYLGCLAYVENGILFFSTVAVGLLLDAAEGDQKTHYRTMLAAGVCAGLAGGCKYPALLFVTVALIVAWLITARFAAAPRIKSLLIYGLGATLAFCPWLIKNAAFTGNPVYPFAYEWFGGAAWSAEQAQQWSRAHSLPDDQRDMASRLGRASREIVGDFTPGGFRPALFGPVLILFGIAGMLGARSRVSIFQSVWLVLILVLWIGYTFIAGRFAVPLIIPLAHLGGALSGIRSGISGDGASIGGRGNDSPRGFQWLVLVVLLAGSAYNARILTSKLGRHADYWLRQADIRLADVPGNTDLAVTQNIIAGQIPPDGYAWMIGDAAVYYVDRRLHYTVAFCRDPWLEFAVGHTPGETLGWLRERDVTHVVFVWKEIDRLRETYGFSPIVTDEWVRGLENAGLRLVAELPSPVGGRATRVHATR